MTVSIAEPPTDHNVLGPCKSAPIAVLSTPPSGGESDLRIIGCDRYPDLRIGQSDSALRSRDVGPPLKKLRRQPHRNLRRQRGEGQVRNRKRRGCLTSQNRDGVLELRTLDAGLDILGAGRLQLGLGLGHIHVRRNAAAITGFGEVQGVLEVDNGRIQQLLLQVQPAKRKIIDRQLRVQAQADVFKVARACLRVFLGRLDRAPNLSPEIGLVREISLKDRIAVLTLRRRVEVRPVLRKLGSRAGRSGSESRKELRTSLPNHISRAHVLVIDHFQILIGDSDLLLQRVELRVAIDLPPLALRKLVLRGLPASSWTASL